MCKMLNVEEYKELYVSLLRRMAIEITLANRTGELDELAEKYGFVDILEKFESNRKQKQKLLIAGNTKIKKNKIHKVCKQYGFEPDEVEVLSYKEMKSFDAKKIKKYKFAYIGQTPHKTKGLGKNKCIRTRIKKCDQTELINVGDNCLKLTLKKLNRCLSSVQLMECR